MQLTISNKQPESRIECVDILDIGSEELEERIVQSDSIQHESNILVTEEQVKVAKQKVFFLYSRVQ